MSEQAKIDNLLARSLIIAGGFIVAIGIIFYYILKIPAGAILIWAMGAILLVPGIYLGVRSLRKSKIR